MNLYIYLKTFLVLLRIQQKYFTSKMNFNNWRSCIDWKNEGLEMNTTSNEAAKLYDITLSQLIGLLI